MLGVTRGGWKKAKPLPSKTVFLQAARLILSDSLFHIVNPSNKPRPRGVFVFLRLETFEKRIAHMRDVCEFRHSGTSYPASEPLANPARSIS